MSWVEQKIIGILRKLASLGNLVLIFLMSMAALDITLRSLFGISIRGGWELITNSMVVLVFLCIPLRCYTNEHIKVDMIDPWVKKSRKRGLALGSINYLIMLAFSSLMIWQSTVYARLVQEAAMATPILKMPVYPFIYLIAFSYLCAFLATLLAMKNLWFGDSSKGETEIENLTLSSIK
jgi:TRAP-type C4-dicarboxylate transport system permease small subunit